MADCEACGACVSVVLGPPNRCGPSSVLVSHRYPGVLLAGSSLSCMLGDQRAWPLGTIRTSVRIKVLADFGYLGIRDSDTTYYKVYGSTRPGGCTGNF